jgi:hypothetical protein
MRAKVVFPVAALGVLILGLAFYYRFAPHSAGVAAPSSDPVAEAAPVPEQAAPAKKLFAVSAHPTDDVPIPDSTPDNSGGDLDPVTARIAQLGDLGTSNDTISLKTILSELNNQEPRIRQAALNASVQFGSPDAIPALRNEMNWAEDPHEKAAIQDAIDFLQLPSVDSVRQEYTAQQAADSGSN